MSICFVDGCGREVKGLGLCGKHYQRQRLHGTPEDRKGCCVVNPICSVDGCGGKIEAAGLCQKHYKRFKKHGTPDAGKWTQAPVEDRFWHYVNKTDSCWIWTGKSKNQYGHGKLRNDKKDVSAHRLSYEIHKGQIPDGMVVMHSCDNPSCVNPDHLSIGTQSQNIKDMYARGRQPPMPPHKCGEDNKRSKLKEVEVLEILKSQDSIKVLAARYRVSRKPIENIKRGLTWKHLPRT